MKKPEYVTPQDIVATAISYLGKDVSPNDTAPDEFGCAETITDLLSYAGCDIPEILSTITLNHFFIINTAWEKVNIPQAGDIIICVTGTGGRNGVTNGHVGVLLNDHQIASNDSATGRFIQNYTLDTWKARWVTLGGYPLIFYRKRYTVPTPPPPPAPAPVQPQPAPVTVPPEDYAALKRALDFLQVIINNLWIRMMDRRRSGV